MSNPRESRSPRSRSRAGVLVGAAVVAGLALLIALAMRGPGAEGSTLGRGAGGWLGVYAVLEQRGLTVDRLDRRLEHLVPSSQGDSGSVLEMEDGPPYTSSETTIVTAFPWQSGLVVPDTQAIARHLRSGGRVVVGYSGGELAWIERLFLDDLGISQDEVERNDSLLPWTWWKQQRADVHRPVGRLAAASSTVSHPETAPLHWVPEAPTGDNGEILLVNAAGDPVLTRRRQLGGEIWLLPTSLLANGYLSHPANSAVLLMLESSLGSRLVFDEYHHGLVGQAAASETTASQSALDTTLIQLGLVYLFALIAFAWRFGPSWPPRAPSRDSHKEFLLGIGGVHERLDHDVDAARTLIDRAGTYWPRHFDDRRLADLRADVTRTSLLDVARELSLHRADKPTGHARPPARGL